MHASNVNLVDENVAKQKQFNEVSVSKLVKGFSEVE